MGEGEGRREAKANRLMEIFEIPKLPSISLIDNLIQYARDAKVKQSIYYDSISSSFSTVSTKTIGKSSS